MTTQILFLTAFSFFSGLYSMDNMTNNMLPLPLSPRCQVRFAMDHVRALNQTSCTLDQTSLDQNLFTMLNSWDKETSLVMATNLLMLFESAQKNDSNEFVLAAKNLGVTFE